MRLGDLLPASMITCLPTWQSLSVAPSRICTPFEMTQLSNTTLQQPALTSAHHSQLRAERLTHFSPMTTPSMMTLFVNFDPLPTKQPLPMMHRLTPTFSPKLAYTLACK